MRHSSLVGLFILGLAASPLAAETQQKPPPLIISISKTDCSRLVRHTPSPDVAYKPGVDVHGKPVVGADVDPVQAGLAKRLVPDVLEFPLTINPVNYAGRKAAYRSKSTTEAAIAAGGGTPTAAQSEALATAESKLAGYSAKGLDSTQAKLGTIRYDMAKGIFTLDGQPLVSEDQAQLAEACARQGVK